MTYTREINENYFKKLIKMILTFFGYKIVKINNFNDKYNDFILEASDNEKKDIDDAIKLALCSRASLWSMMLGVQILRVHDVNEVNQAIKVFKKLNF